MTVRWKDGTEVEFGVAFCRDWVVEVEDEFCWEEEEDTMAERLMVTVFLG